MTRVTDDTIRAALMAFSDFLDLADVPSAVNNLDDNQRFALYELNHAMIMLDQYYSARTGEGRILSTNDD